jgi:hypothetical protein
VRLTTYLRLLPGVKKWVELYLHSPNTLSWRGAQGEYRSNFTFTFLYKKLLLKLIPTVKQILSYKTGETV